MPRLTSKEIENQRPNNEILQILQRATKKVECAEEKAGLCYIDPITNDRYFFEEDSVPREIYGQISAHIRVIIPNKVDYYILK